MLAPEGVSAMMGHSRDFLLMSKFSGDIVWYLENTFILLFIHRASMVQNVYEIQSLNALGVEST